MIGYCANKKYIRLIADNGFARPRDRAVIHLEHAFPIGSDEGMNARSLVPEKQREAWRHRKRDLAARRTKATRHVAETRIGDGRMIYDGGRVAREERVLDRLVYEHVAPKPARKNLNMGCEIMFETVRRMCC